MTIDISASINACAAYYGEDGPAMRDYLLAGEARAQAMTNRGPIRFDEDGRLHPDILAAYSEVGFYVFEGAVEAAELADLRADIDDLRNRFPAGSNSQVTTDGRPAMNANNKAPTLLWSKPLSDPFGGTAIAAGLHLVKLYEPQAASDAPVESPFILLGPLQFSPACLRLYAHPKLARVAATINGDDYAPFHETLFIKDPGLGAAVSWHQDGNTHWDSPEFDEGIHGFNFMTQLFHSTAVNGVWALPGSHKVGKLDIAELVESAGSERLPEAVPMLAGPGDVIISNRQLLHGSFANTGLEPRLSINTGFHRRSSVLDVKGAGIHSEAVVYDKNHIEQRSQIMGIAVNARREKFPEEETFTSSAVDPSLPQHQWSPEAMNAIQDYNLLDLSI